MLNFKIEAVNGEARRGKMELSRGTVETPVFMPVGTAGAVKALAAEDVAETGAQIILGNTYHLHQRPGEKTVAAMGGLAEFNNWKKPTLTDSGGFQVFSLNERVKITEDGVEFKSDLNGSSEFWQPETSVEIQRQIGADIIMALDECTPDKGKKYAREAMERTHRWLKRCKTEWEKNSNGQAMFGIVQGGDYRDLRQESGKYVAAMELPGVAIGGVSIGYDMDKTIEHISWVKEVLPKDKPFYAMGVGRDPEDIVRVIKAGADMFDCVAPTRIARHGGLYSGHLSGKSLAELSFKSEFEKGRLNIGSRRYKEDRGVIDEGCDCYTCSRGYSRGYLRHLYKAGELSYFRLASIHNVRFMVRLADQIRAII